MRKFLFSIDPFESVFPAVGAWIAVLRFTLIFSPKDEPFIISFIPYFSYVIWHFGHPWHLR